MQNWASATRPYPISHADSINQTYFIIVNLKKKQNFFIRAPSCPSWLKTIPQQAELKNSPQKNRSPLAIDFFSHKLLVMIANTITYTENFTFLFCYKLLLFCPEMLLNTCEIVRNRFKMRQNAPHFPDSQFFRSLFYKDLQGLKNSKITIILKIKNCNSLFLKNNSPLLLILPEKSEISKNGAFCIIFPEQFFILKGET